MTSIKDPLGQAFIEFCESQGIKFVDSKTGEGITSDAFKRERRQNENKE